MKFLQALAVLVSIGGGIFGLSSTASAAPLTGAQALSTADSGGLVVQVRNGRNGAIAAGAVLGVLGTAAIISSQQHHDDDYYYRRHHRDYDDDDYDARPHCRYGSYIDHRGMRRCRP